MNTILELKKTIIYGPVRSRRLGESLGINLLPGTAKLCSFDCVYCQYGWTSLHRARAEKAPGEGGAAGIPSPGEVERALVWELERLEKPPAFLTLSGNGEATVVRDFHLYVDAVLEVGGLLAPAAKTAILSNSSTVLRREVRASLAKLDYAIMKLDCGDEETFLRYNRPCSGVTLDAVTEGLASLSRERPVTIQALFAKGESGNCNERSLAGGLERLQAIQPREVQVYTLHRGYPAPALEALSPGELSAIGEWARGAGITVAVF